MIIDTHTHLNASPLFENCREVIQRARENNIVAVFNNADNLASFAAIDILQKKFPSFCYSVLGIHPEYADTDSLEKLTAMIKDRIETVKAIGEIGLDYHYPLTSEQKERQKKVFSYQIELAKTYHLPLVIHSRDADQDTFDILVKQASEMKVDLHCYSGSAELAREYLKKIPQIHFGIGGVITFKNARRLIEVVTDISLSHLLTETDAPYLAPAPFRGATNEPSYLPLIIKKISAIKNIPEEETERQLYKSAADFYSL